MSTIRRSTYADRAAHFQAAADSAHAAGELQQATDLEALAQRARQAHQDRTWQHAEGLRYDNDECCHECREHISDPHGPSCIYADAAYASA